MPKETERDQIQQLADDVYYQVTVQLMLNISSGDVAGVLANHAPPVGPDWAPLLCDKNGRWFIEQPKPIL